MWRFAFVTCASVTHAAVLEGVLDDLVVQFHDMPISVVEAAIANSLGKSLGIEGLPSSDVACMRDYGAACPKGWADQGDGETSSVPRYYQGPCSEDVNFATTTNQIIVNKTSALTMTLPASASAGDTVTIKATGGGTVTIGRNSQKINSVAGDGTLQSGKATQLVFVDSTIGFLEI